MNAAVLVRPLQAQHRNKMSKFELLKVNELMTNTLNRRQFLQTTGIKAAIIALTSAKWSLGEVRGNNQTVRLPAEWFNPPNEFSQAPFWFWNDDLSEKELLEQMDDFKVHGVHAFLIHPRAGLPTSIGWLSDRMIYFMRFAIEKAAERDMWVILYDEGMYPSGSSSGQVVAENPRFRTRGLVCIDLEEAKNKNEVLGVRLDKNGEPHLTEGQNLVAIVQRKKNGHRLAVVDRAVQEGYSLIRGLHFVEADPPRRDDHKEVAENSPPAADILNPDAVACFIQLVYQRYYNEFGRHFGKTVKAIFTDEPSLLAKRAEPGMVPGTTGILGHINTFLGYDFTEHLAALWYDDEPDAGFHRRNYNRAIQARLGETFYHQISEWCSSHGICLTGHPMGPDDIGHLRYFHIPGQDIVWRYIEPNKPSSLEGEQSTQAKCASSAMIHLGRRRNANEFCGAYGHNFTFEEMKWLANWLIVRGCNLLIPHAFYYSIRGPRIDERPPDVGPNSSWWQHYEPFALSTHRLCWLNTDSKHICKLAILGLNDHLPWRTAKICLQNQRDFNYLEARHLWEDARVDFDGIHLAGMQYQVLILEDDPPEKAKTAIDILAKAGRIIHWDETISNQELIQAIDKLIQPDVQVSPAAPDLRVRHVLKAGHDYYLLFNEGDQDIELKLKLSVKGKQVLLDPISGQSLILPVGSAVRFPRYTMHTLFVETE